MNVVDLGSEDGRDRGLDVIKSNFNEDLEDRDQVDTMDD
jgi:hypothetical protein